ncbi:hypothetical protein GF312_22370 [Candidatus Poribacteria bacterium]|nr:hypothetical protein [Candidatus Poribacteria bacterium]
MKNRKHKIFINSIIMTGIFLMIFTSFSLTAEEENKTLIYDFTAKKTSIARKTGITIFEGDAKMNVRASDEFLNADKVTIYRDVETGELIKMVAEGNVDMNQQGIKATCDKAIFYEQENRIELEGTEEKPAVVDEENNRMEAPKIILYRDEDRIEASGNVTGHVEIERQEQSSEKSEEKNQDETGNS